MACPEEQIITDNNRPDMDDCPGGDEEGEAMVEEALSGDDDDDDDASSEPNWGMDHSAVVNNVKELHISSPILAAKSPFFYKVALILSVSFLFAHTLDNIVFCFLS